MAHALWSRPTSSNLDHLIPPSIQSQSAPVACTSGPMHTSTQEQVRCEADEVGLCTEIIEDEDGLPNLSENGSSNVATSPSPPPETPRSSAPLSASSKRSKRRKIQTPSYTSEELSNSDQIVDIIRGSLNYVNSTRHETTFPEAAGSVLTTLVKDIPKSLQGRLLSRVIDAVEIFKAENNIL